MAKIAKKTKRYPSDLTDEEWERIAPLMPKPGRRGRPREVDFREVINAVRYLVRSGCGWDAVDPLRGVADGLWLVPRVGAALPVPDYSRHRTDARTRAAGTRTIAFGGGSLWLGGSAVFRIKPPD